MNKLTGKLLVIFLIAFAAVECQRWNSYNGRPVNGRKTSRLGSAYYSDEVNGNGGKSAEVHISQPPKNQAAKPSSRGGIGAWGYVFIILFVILSGLGVYYTIIFYPIVCKKQRMYHVMGHTTV